MALGEVQIDEATLQLAAFDAQNPLFQRHSMGGTDPHMILQLDNNNVGCGYSVVLGRNNTVSGADSVALGVDNTVTGVKSFAVNSMNTVSGNMSAAFGNRNEVNGDASVALGGNNNKVSGANSVVTGHMNIANGDMQVVTGIYNKADENAAFIIGNGTSEDNRSNAFIVQKSGSAVFAGKLTIGAQPIDDMDVATKQYVDGKAEQNGKTSVQIITWEDED